MSGAPNSINGTLRVQICRRLPRIWMGGSEHSPGCAYSEDRRTTRKMELLDLPVRGFVFWQRGSPRSRHAGLRPAQATIQKIVVRKIDFRQRPIGSTRVSRDANASLLNR
jgi:hypothetical protein